jgi:hypothetical protein
VSLDLFRVGVKNITAAILHNTYCGMGLRYSSGQRQNQYAKQVFHLLPPVKGLRLVILRGALSLSVDIAFHILRKESRVLLPGDQAHLPGPHE